MRNFYAIGNWKMHKTAREAADYVGALAAHIQGVDARVWLAVPFTAIAACSMAAKETPIVIGAQNMSDEKEGPFTGEISALMLKEAGASFVLIGHSERRRLFHEDNKMIRRKVIRALQDDLTPVLCVGETEKERDAGKTEEVLREQIRAALEGVPHEGSLILAYEPVWAIGTGKTASAHVAEEAHRFCRECLIALFGKKGADAIPIVYGGSVKADNTAELMQRANIEGVLVGGASLDASIFSQIARSCKKQGIRS